LLSDAVGAYLESVSERAFDEPLMALLRARGFTSVRLVHGSREFGKDVIARRNGEQWGFQSKAGDIGQPEWRTLTGQLDELRIVNLGHGAFDTELPRRAVLVTTGRLVGNAPELYGDYNKRANEKGEPELELWDRDILLGQLGGDPESVLSGSMDGQLMLILGAAESRSVTMHELEVFSRRWMTWEPDRLAGLAVIEAALVCEKLRGVDRLDLACHLALCLIRAVWASRAASLPEGISATAARSLFETYARMLWERCDEELLEHPLLNRIEFGGWVTYPVRCVRLAEILGLLALLVKESDPDLSETISRWLVTLCEKQPGVAHPISDQYAVGVIPMTLALATVDREAAETHLRRCAVWLCDRYERDALGLAREDAAPEEEIEHLIGGPFESVQLERRRDSLLAPVLLDLAAALGFSDLYADIYNDVQAVRIYPQMLRLADGPDQYSRTGSGNRIDPNVDFAESLTDGGAIAPHHNDNAGESQVTNGEGWDLLAIGSALRDRYYVRALASLAEG
jgi:Restriction endonuclease